MESIKDRMPANNTLEQRNKFEWGKGFQRAQNAFSVPSPPFHLTLSCIPPLLPPFPIHLPPIPYPLSFPPFSSSSWLKKK